MKRSIGVALTATALLTGTVLMAPRSMAAAPPDDVPTEQAAAGAPGDFAVIGIPGYDFTGTSNAGAAEVRWRDGKAQLLKAPVPQAGAQFGRAVATYDLDKDKHPEILVGAPGLDVSGRVDAGAVYVYRWTTTGFKYWKTRFMGRDGVGGTLQGGAAYGYSMDSDDSGASAPGYDLPGTPDAGAVVWFGGGLMTATSFHQTPQAGDRFGTSWASQSLCGEVGWQAVGAPGRTVNGHKTPARSSLRCTPATV